MTLEAAHLSGLPVGFHRAVGRALQLFFIGSNMVAKFTDSVIKYLTQVRASLVA